MAHRTSGHVPRVFNKAENVPGFTEPKKSKFSRAAVSIIADATYGKTTTNLATKNLKRSSYQVTKRSAGKKDNSNNPPKRFVAQSLNASDFINHMDDVLKLEDLSDASIENAFRRIDVDGSNFIEKSEFTGLLAEVLGETPQPRLVAQLVAHFDSNEDGKVSLGELKSGLRAVAAHKRGQINAPGTVSRHSKPKWMKSDRAVTGAVSSDVHASIQRTDVGGDGAELRDLELGTHKATSHLPGYSGFIPSVTHNAASAHAQATAPRRNKNDLILNETFNPMIKAFKETNYGSMQTTNSKRNAALEMILKRK